MSSAEPGKRRTSETRPVRSSFTSTEAQNNFGQVLSRARREGGVFITRYDRPEAVVLSIEEYEALTGQEPIDLPALEREFDELLEQMQRPEHRRAVDRLFSLTGRELGEAAVRAVADEQ